MLLHFYFERAGCLFGRVERLAMLKRKGQARGDETQRPNSWEVAWTCEENDVGYSCPLAKWGLVDRAEVVYALAARTAIRYLAQNFEQGIVTPLTYAYRDAILRRIGAADMAEAETETLSSTLRLALRPRPGGGSGFRPTDELEGATGRLQSELDRAKRVDCWQPRDELSIIPGRMANLYYDDRLIIAFASQNQSDKQWSAGAEITWSREGRRHSHTIGGLADRFKTSEDAERYVINLAKAWIDANP